VLATESPAELIRRQGAQTLDDAFISYLEQESESLRDARDADPPLPGSPTSDGFANPRPSAEHLRPASFSPRRAFAYAKREALELMRDRIRLGFALFGTAFLMLIIGFGITTDVDSLTFAALDRDRTPESRAYLNGFRGSRYFIERPPITDYADLERRLRSADVRATIEIPPGFGRDIKKGTPTSVGVWIDGAMPFRAETIRGYIQGVHQHFLAELAQHASAGKAATAVATIETRFRYNQDFKSVYAMVPSTMALLLVLIEHHDRQRSKHQHREVRQRGDHLAQHNRPRTQRAGEQHFIGLPLLLPANRAGGKAGGHHRGQHVLAQEEQVHKLAGLVGVARPRQVELLVLRPRQVNYHRQQGLIGQQQQKRPLLPQVHQQLPLHDGVFDEVHASRARKERTRSNGILA
jgi:hypothetical protein